MCVLQSSNVKELLLQLQIEIHGAWREKQLHVYASHHYVLMKNLKFANMYVARNDARQIEEVLQGQQSATDMTDTTARLR
jgi:hypothetical protein